MLILTVVLDMGDALGREELGRLGSAVVVYVTTRDRLDELDIAVDCSLIVDLRVEVEVEEDCDFLLENDNGVVEELDVTSDTAEALVTVTMVVDGSTAIAVRGSMPCMTLAQKFHAQSLNISRSEVIVQCVVHTLSPEKVSDSTVSESQKHSSNVSCVSASGWHEVCASCNSGHDTAHSGNVEVPVEGMMRVLVSCLISISAIRNLVEAPAGFELT